MVQELKAQAWDELSRDLYGFIRPRVANDADARDVLQNVLLRMHTGLGGLKSRDRLAPWMRSIARNALADHYAARARFPIIEDAAVRTVADGETGGESEDEDDPAARLSQVLVGFVDMLPEPYRTAVRLTELEGRTHREAAQSAGVSLSAMKSRVRRGRGQLRTMLTDCCEIALDARGKVIECTPRRPGRPVDDCCS